MKSNQMLLKLMVIIGLLSLLALGTYAPSPAAAQTHGSIPTAQLSDAEIENLLFMREEEKLARDVYLTLSQSWGLPIFQNIARSETTHMAALKTLIDRYGLADPALSETGVFTDPTLQQLYDQLVSEGSQSLADALRVGAAIEEIDILDLQTHLAETEQADIQQVYGLLLKGSRNHLRAFTTTLQRQTGQTYQPQYLDPADYEDIVSSPMETGNGAGRGNGRGPRGNR